MLNYNTKYDNRKATRGTMFWSLIRGNDDFLGKKNTNDHLNHNINSQAFPTFPYYNMSLKIA
jgi:hypothetical protein